MASILVIETSDTLRALFRELLERAGHVVQEASRGFEGIRQYRQSPTDLVITDIHLPDCNGLDVIVTLGQQSSAVKILAVSGKSGEQDALLTSKLLGADAIVEDALDGESILKQVDDLVGGT